MRMKRLLACLFRCPREQDSFPATLGKRLSGYEGGKNEEEGTEDWSQDGYDGIRRKWCWLGQFGDWGAVVEVVDPW